MKYIIAAALITVFVYFIITMWSILLASKDDWPGQEYPRPFDDLDDED